MNKPSPTLRIIDANANRAREALRVMEEAARFALNDPALTAACKQLRHDLVAALAPLPPLAAHRDTPADVGTGLTTAAEARRRDIRHVVTAAAARLAEALRVCEEYGKSIDPAFAAGIELLRYRTYHLEKRLLARLPATRARQFRLCVLVTEAFCSHLDWFDVARAALDAGADCLQLREKHLDDARLFERACRLAELVGQTHRPARRAGQAPPARPALFINDRPDIALLSGADGVHLGQADLPLQAVRRLVGPDLMIGLSTHNLVQAGRAVRDGADYCGLGPMFPTTTTGKKPAGPAYLQRFLRRHPDMPHLAIGGITPDNLPPLRRAGARGIAVCQCVCSARKPATVVRRLLRLMRD